MTTLIIIIAVIAIPFLIALFTARSVTIQRDITIKRSVPDVFSYVKYLKNSRQYSKWVMQDPDSKLDFEGTDGAPGFKFSWDSQMKQVGKGSQDITKVLDNDRVETAIHFIKPFKGEAVTSMSTEALSTGDTRVRWVFTNYMNYPMNFMLLVMNMDKILGKDLDKSLINLKGILEK